MRKVARGDVTPAPAVRQVLQLYGKVEEPAIEAVYRTLMSQISPTQLRDLAVRFVGELACDAVEATTGDEGATAEIRARVREHPNLVNAMTRDYFVNASELLHLRDQEIGRFTKDRGSEAFKNALSWIASEVGNVAYRWFAGDVLDTHDLGKLGVSGPLMSAQMAKLGLQLLAAHCGQTGAALLL